VLPAEHGKIAHIDVTLSEWYRMDDGTIAPLIREPVVSLATEDVNTSTTSY
jgi:hypothetical protein